MKKVLFLLLAIVLIAPSCKKKAPTIEGKWHLYKSAIVSEGDRQEKDENSYYEFASGTVKITSDNGFVNDFSYSFDQDNDKITIGRLDYSVEKFTAKEMVWRSEGTTVTVIGGKMVKIVEEYYDYFRKE